MSELKKYIKVKHHFQKMKLLSGKSLGIRGWLVKEEKDFLFAVETQMDNHEVIINECVALARKCVDDEKTFDGLTRSDLLFVLSELRKISKGSEIEFSYHCTNEKCPDWLEFSPERKKETGMDGQGRTPFDGKLSLKDEVKTKSFGLGVSVELGANKFILKEVPYLTQRELEKKYISEEAINLSAFNYDFILNSIGSIEIGEKVIDDFTLEELDNFISTLNTTDFQTLSDKAADNLSEFNVSKKVSCPKCGNEDEVIYEELFSLLVF